MGKVLAVGGILPKLQAAIEAGCAEVLMPKENERDVQMTPDYMRNKIKVRYVSSIQEVLAAALVLSGELLIVHNSHRLFHDLLIKPRRTADRR